MTNEPRSVANLLRKLAEENERRVNSGEAENRENALGASAAYRDAANFIEETPLAIEGEIDEAKFRMRQSLGSGEIEGEEFDVSLNIDGMALFFEFGEERVSFDVREMGRAAHAMLFGGESEEENPTERMREEGSQRSEPADLRGDGMPRGSPPPEEL